MSYTRTIPACAGEPAREQISAPTALDYPRVCGGTVNWNKSDYVIEGLSPRVRGNHDLSMDDGDFKGTIPACAGEPLLGNCRRMQRRDYPRVCGGTCRVRRAVRPGSGLSPRVRGNRLSVRLSVVYGGTIPACAGEPPPGL